MGELGISVLVTRTQPGASETAARLADMGYLSVLNPVLEIHLSSLIVPPIEGVQAVIATSTAGIDALARVSGLQDVPLFCFSGASARTATTSDFYGDIYEYSGNGEGLSQWVGQQLSPENGPVLWVRGRNVAFDMKTALIAHGYEVREWEAYEARPVKALQLETAEALHQGLIRAALFHSARGAQVFVELATKNGLLLEGVTAIAISENAAKPLNHAGFFDRFIARAPNEDAVMRMLQDSVPVRQN